jgi:phosphonate transport system substrate-binding protein
MPLSLVTCLAENTQLLSKAIANYLSLTLGIPIFFQENLDFEEQTRGLITGKINLGFMCGLLYTELKDKKFAPLQPLVAPVSLCVTDKIPSYYSYVIVKQGSPYRYFSDLEHSCFCINEQASFSGCQVVRYHLATLGKTNGYFSKVMESGFHLQSIEAVLSGNADSAAIDHTLFEYWAKKEPELAKTLRVIERLGPFPMPPLVISEMVPEQVKQHIQKALLEMPADLLKEFEVLEFQAVNDQSYDPIREAARLSEKVKLYL